MTGQNFWRNSLPLLLLLWVSRFTLAAAQPVDLWVSQAYVHCYNSFIVGDHRYFGKAEQEKLYLLYHQDPTYQEAYTLPSKPLSDGLYGQETHNWLAYFCTEFNLPLTADHQIFVDRIKNGLAKAAQITVNYPHWRDVIAPSKVLRLTDAELTTALAEPSEESQDDPKEEPQLSEPKDEPAAPSDTKEPQIADVPQQSFDYYQLTEEDLEQLKAYKAALTAIDKLSAQKFADHSALYNSLHQHLARLGLAKVNIEKLLKSQLLPASSSTAEVSSTTQPVAAKDATTKLLQAPTTSAGNTKSKSQKLIWRISTTALHQHLRNVKSPSKTQLQQLQSLAGDVFINRYLFQMALAMTFAANEQKPENKMLEQILNQAGKTGGPPLEQQTGVIWQADDCGCEGSKNLMNQADKFYGFYPYWLHPDGGQELNFSRLDRIGYVAATLKTTPKGAVLIVPPNWNTSKKDSQFIQKAHQYRTAVDLVVTVKEDANLKLLFADPIALATTLAQNIKQPLDQYIRNRAQPWLSLGFTKVPTLGDGITLDIDATTLNKLSPNTLLTFVQALKGELNQQEGKAINAQSDDRYYLNLVIPLAALIGPTDAENGGKNVAPNHHYTFSNLRKLAKFSNLLILRPGDPTQGGDAQNVRLQYQQFIQWMATRRDQAAVDAIYTHLMPMLITEDNHDAAELKELIHLSNWSLLGAAFWPLPLSKPEQLLVKQIFFTEDEEQTLFSQLEQDKKLTHKLSLIETIFNWICPHRWLVRLVLFGVFSFITVILLASLWYYPWRKWIVSLPFTALCAGALFVLMMSFIADPSFKEMQGAISLGFMLLIAIILLIVYLFRREGDKP